MLLLTAACTAAPATTDAPVASTPVVTNPPTVLTTTLPPPDPPTLLASGLAAYAGGYSFDATATVNDQVATRVTGRRVGDSSQFLIQSGDGQVEYLITPQGEWARAPEEDWQAVSDTTAAGDPMAPLATPTSLDLASWVEGQAVLVAVYDGTALGAGPDPVTVALTFTDGVLTQARYQQDANGTTLVSTTNFTPLADTTPITAPPAQ